MIVIKVLGVFVKVVVVSYLEEEPYLVVDLASYLVEAVSFQVASCLVVEDLSTVADHQVASYLVEEVLPCLVAEPSCQELQLLFLDQPILLVLVHPAELSTLLFPLVEHDLVHHPLLLLRQLFLQVVMVVLPHSL